MIRRACALATLAVSLPLGACAPSFDDAVDADEAEVWQAYLASLGDACDAPADVEAQWACLDVAAARERLGEILLTPAWKQDTPEAYAEVRDRLPVGTAAVRVLEDRIAEIAFAEADRVHTTESWDAFLTAFATEDTRAFLQKRADRPLIDEARTRWAASRHAENLPLEVRVDMQVPYGHYGEGEIIPGWEVAGSVVNRGKEDVLLLQLEALLFDAAGATVARETFHVVAYARDPEQWHGRVAGEDELRALGVSALPPAPGPYDAQRQDRALRTRILMEEGGTVARIDEAKERLRLAQGGSFEPTLRCDDCEMGGGMRPVHLVAANSSTSRDILTPGARVSFAKRFKLPKTWKGNAKVRVRRVVLGSTDAPYGAQDE